MTHEESESAVREENEKCAQILECGAEKLAADSTSRNLLEAHARVIRATFRLNYYDQIFAVESLHLSGRETL